MTYDLFKHAPTPWFADIDGTVLDRNERIVVRVVRWHNGSLIFDIIADALVAFANGQNFDRLFSVIGTEPWNIRTGYIKSGDLLIAHNYSTRGDSDDEHDISKAVIEMVNLELKSYLQEKADA